jgi:hypothetical protein
MCSSKKIASCRFFDAKVLLFVILKMNLTEIIAAIIAMPVRQCIAYHTFACWFVVVKILSRLRRLVLLLPPQFRTPTKRIRNLHKYYCFTRKK